MLRFIFCLLFLPASVLAQELSLDEFIDSKCTDVSDDICVDMYMAYKGDTKPRHNDRDDTEEYYDDKKGEYHFSYEDGRKRVNKMHENEEFSEDFKKSDIVNDEKMLKAMQGFMERECKDIPQIACAEKFLSQEDSKNPDPSYKAYKKNRPKLIREFKKHHPDFED